MDENKSLYLQTFIFVHMNFSLYISVLRPLVLCRYPNSVYNRAASWHLKYLSVVPCKARLDKKVSEYLYVFTSQISLK